MTVIRVHPFFCTGAPIKQRIPRLRICFPKFGVRFCGNQVRNRATISPPRKAWYRSSSLLCNIFINLDLELPPSVIHNNSHDTLPHPLERMAAASSRLLMKASASSTNFTRRSLSSQSALLAARPSSRISQNLLQQSFRRTYADAAPVVVKKPKKFGYFTAIWRLTYLSAIAGTAYLAYGVYELRHPDDQFEPDPTKKNLVILGKQSN